MELVTNEAAIKAQRQHTGTEVVTVNPGEWLQIRTGTPASPTTVLEVQCPADKEPWQVALQVAINETDA